MQLGFSSIITNNFTGYSHVSNFGDLPSASDHTNEYFIVDNSSGVWLINRKEAGFYKSNGTSWVYIGSAVDTTSLKVGTTTIVASPIELVGANGISLTADSDNNKITLNGNSLTTPTVLSGNGAPTSTPSKIGDVYIDTTLSTHPVFYSANGTASSANWIKQNNGYSIRTVITSNTAVVDSTTLYGADGYTAWSSLSNGAQYAKLYIPKTGILTSAFIGAYIGTPGSSEPNTIYIRKNDTTDYLITNNLLLNVQTPSASNQALNIPVNAGDYLCLKWIIPNMATNPSATFLNAQFYIET